MAGKRTWSFTLIVSPPTVDEEEAAGRLYGAGCDDATFGVSNGAYSLDFDREAASLEEAVASAKADVGRAGIGSTVERVEIPEE